MTEQALTIQHPAGYSTSAILTTPASSSNNNKLVLLCHGFLSNKNSTTNKRLTELLVPHGISTCRFDWQGMGDSGGKFEDLTVTACSEQVDQIIEVMVAKGYHGLGLIGSSFGGLLGILACATHSEVKALGLKCPVPDFPEMLKQEFGTETMEKWKRTDLIPNLTGGSEPIHLKYGFYEDCRLINAYEKAQAIRTPTLIMHGDQDELVPLQQIHRLNQALGGKKELHLVQGANHAFARPEDFRTMTVLLADWMVRYLPTQTVPEAQVK